MGGSLVGLSSRNQIYKMQHTAPDMMFLLQVSLAAGDFYLVRTRDASKVNNAEHGAPIRAEDYGISSEIDTDKSALKGDTLSRFSGVAPFSITEMSKKRERVRRKKKPPVDDHPPKCLKPPCHLKKIKVKFYVNDDIQEWTDEAFKTQLNKTLKKSNEDLARLDNGGYKVFYEDIRKLGNSDVKLKGHYTDRLDRNKIKAFSKESLLAYTFAFQEAVQELPNRNDVDIRILLVKRLSHWRTVAFSEEHCLCKPRGFGCVVVFSIDTPWKWHRHRSLFSHEIGHTLGPAFHDDDFYIYNPYNNLIMWSVIDRGAYIWSPETRQAINEQDHSCLELEMEPDVCDEPTGVVGSCRRRITMWTFHKYYRKCVPYFGCKEGKGNKFNSRKECENKCIVKR